MERYFIATEDSSLRKDYFNYKENNRKVLKIVSEFMKKHGIETEFYYANNNKFYIVPTENDKEKFSNILNKEVNYELRQFRTNSKIGKDWIKTLEKNNVKIIDRPYLGFYFNNVYGRHSSRLFDVEGVVYCSLSTVCEYEVPKGLKEIKASEFFKVIEDYEEKTKEQN